MNKMELLSRLIAFSVAASVILNSALAHEVFNPDSYTSGETYVIAAWNFNWTSGESNFQKRQRQRSVTHGKGKMVDNFSVGLMVPAPTREKSGLGTNGSVLNIYKNDLPGQSLCVSNGKRNNITANKGGSFQFQISMKNLESLVMTYAGRRNSEGSMSVNQWSYSFNGREFIPLKEPVTHNVGKEFKLHSVIFPSHLNNQNIVFIRNTVLPGDAKNPQPHNFNLYDNLRFEANAKK